MNNLNLFILSQIFTYLLSFFQLVRIGYLLLRSQPMDGCFSAFNTKGFSQALNSNQIPPSSHFTYGGCFNELKFSIGSRAVKPLELHIGYARSQNQHSAFDNKINNYLALFTKGSKDGADRDGRHLNAVIILDVSGSMGSGLTSQGQGCRIQLAKKAILMFFSKMRKTDSFGLIIFNNDAQVLISLQKVSQIDFQVLSITLKEVSSGGGTTLIKGLDKANAEFKTFMSQNNEAKSHGSENRIIMLTDVQDNSVSQSKKFIQSIETSGIHTTIIGISDSFRSQVCEQLIQVKGFNYFCATQIDDLDKYLFRNFDFTFFPSNYNTAIKIKSDNIASIQVFGTPDAEKVPTYNVGSTNQFIITQAKTSFPSELQLSQEGEVKQYGGLILVKLNLKNRELPAFDGTINLQYKTSEGNQMHEDYNIHYEVPLNEQFYSSESLFEALIGFLYSYEVKNILKSCQEVGKYSIPKQHIFSLQKLKALAPESKKKQLDDLITTAKSHQIVETAQEAKEGKQSNFKKLMNFMF